MLIEVIKNIITNVLTALYQPFGFSVVLAVLFMFLYLYVGEHGWREAFQRWRSAFKENTTFRRIFILAFYTAMILFRTLLNRDMWMNPLSDIMGSLGLYNEQGQLTTEAIENLMLFIPFTILLLWSLRMKLFKDQYSIKKILWQSTKITFLFSLSIEVAQLFFRLGTFQLSDLFYNALGGFIGGVIYFIGVKVKKIV